MGLMGQPPSPSASLGGQSDVEPLIQPNSHDLFVHSMKHFLHHSEALDPKSLSGCWLAALTHMQATSRADAVEHIVDWHQLLQLTSDQGAAMRQHAKKLRILAASMTDDIDQLSHFRRCCSSVRHEDYEKTVAMTERLLQEVNMELRAIQDNLEDHYRAQSTEATILTTKESHSAIAGKYFAPSKFTLNVDR